MVNSKSAFWKAFLFTLMIFLIGFFAGLFIENSRASTIQTDLLNSEVNLLDEQVRSNAIQEFSLDCNASQQSIFNFADRIYQEALKLEQYDSSNKLVATLAVYHKRYDLLRVLLWTDSIKMRQQCGNQYHTVVYLYDYNTQEINKKAQQMALDSLLLDFKYKYPSKTLLIPIAVNLNVESVNVVLTKYNITGAPAVIIDEKIVVKNIPTFKELENIVFQSNNT